MQPERKHLILSGARHYLLPRPAPQPATDPAPVVGRSARVVSGQPSRPRRATVGLIRL